MKTIKILLVAAGLLGSAQAMAACSVFIIVKNDTNGTLYHGQIEGPWLRSSLGHELTPGKTFTYHETGSFFSFHGTYYGEYSQKANLSYCAMAERNIINMRENGQAVTRLTGKTSDNKCIFETTKTYNER